MNPHRPYTKDLMEHRHFAGMVGGRMLVTRIVKRKMRKALSVGQVNHTMVTCERGEEEEDQEELTITPTKVKEITSVLISG
jgi:hypothetical protein